MERTESETRGVCAWGGSWDVDESVSVRRVGAFCKAVAWTYCALMGWLSVLWPFFFAVEEQY